MINLSLGIVKSRHNLPVVDYIFEKEIKDIRNVEQIERKVDKYFERNILPKTEKDDITIILYTFNSSIIILSVVRACLLYNCGLIVMHFDKEKHCYFGQQIL